MAEYQHQVPKCLSCGTVGDWEVESILLPRHIVIALILILLGGVGFLYLIFVLIIRSGKERRAKICRRCGARNMFTFLYSDDGAVVPPGQSGFAPPAGQAPIQPMPMPMPVPVAPAPVANTVTMLVAGSPIATLSCTPGASYTIGRAPGNSVVLNDPEVSAHHAAIEVAHDGSLAMRDLGSTNGTLINGTRISATQRVAPGQTITLGQTAVTFA